MDLIYPSGGVPVLPPPSVKRPSSAQGGTSSEMLPVVDESGLVVGQATRSYIHGGSRLLHPVVHLHIVNRMGEVYLQKRSLSKDLYPGYWDTAVGGHVDYGERIMEALYREASEELNFYDFNPIRLKTYIHENLSERELVWVFACVGNFHPEPDGKEVEKGEWFTPQRIADSIGKNILTPNFEGEYSGIADSLQALL